MTHPAPRTRRLARLASSALALALFGVPLAAQYNSAGFEALNASAGGTLLTGQDGFIMPAGIDWNVFTYAGNTLSVPNNPLGATKFVSGTAQSTTVFARAERPVPFGVVSNRYTLTMDICPRYTGTGTPVNNIGSFSLQPSATARYFILLATWPATPTGATWDADLIYFTAAGAQVQVKLPNTAFQGLATGKWYRWQIDFDLGTNQILEIRLMDIAVGSVAAYVPTGWYLAGGSAPTLPLPTALRMFGGGDQFNQVSVDNLELREMSVVNRGDSVATVAVSNTPAIGEMYAVNHQANTATKLTLSAALTSERVNCVTMTSGASGYVGTNPPVVAPGNVYAIDISGTNVTERLVTTSGVVGPNLSQICRVGDKLYFCTQNATNTAGSGVLQSVPVTGGAVTVVSDLSTLTGWVLTNGGANAIAALNGKVYAATFDSNSNVPAQAGCIVEHDPVLNTTKVLMNLPVGKCPSGATTFYNTGICYMQAYGGTLQLFGIFGDYLVVNPTTATVVSHINAAAINPATNLYVSALFNSYDYDASTGDLICGSRDGRVQRIASGHIAQGVVTGVGSNATPGANSVNGMAHVPSASLATDESYGGGCPGNNGFTLTDASSGLPIAGNAAFQLGAYSGAGADLVAVMLATGQQVPGIDLGFAGMPNCKLWITAPIVTIGGTLGGTGFGAGFVRIPLPIPAAALGATLYHQWAEVQATKTNILGVVVSNARKMFIQ